MEPNTENNAEILLRLAEPFDLRDVKWLVAATTDEGRRGRVTPYADPRAYTDRLNEVVTASGWTRQFMVNTIAVTRAVDGKLIQTGKVLATCTLTINGIGTHTGTGEEWADDKNAMTSADAQAFKRASSCFGLGRYFYSVPEMWVELNHKKQPKRPPQLPAWAIPRGQASAKQQPTKSEQRPRAASVVARTALDGSITIRIEKHRQDLGYDLYRSILVMVAQVRSARDIPNQQVQQSVLHWMESGARGMAQIRAIAAEIPEARFYSILDRHAIQSLARVPSFGVLRKLVEEMAQAAPRKSAA